MIKKQSYILKKMMIQTLLKSKNNIFFGIFSNSDFLYFKFNLKNKKGDDY